MKKILFGALAIAVLFSSGIAISKIANAADPVCLTGEVIIDGVCRTGGSFTTVAMLVANQCKPNQVEYSEWSECDHRFGQHGLQWRQIKYPTASGCRPSTYDQLQGTRECLK